ncbi:TPP-dependent indolepyruvate ferredoxin oxidoreductase alpha subunit [Clostridiales Family XIII bacterium PM5-7]
MEEEEGEEEKIELVNGYWVDDRGNKWDSEYYSESEALFFSSTLINCENCTNCLNCINCFGCNGCTNCCNSKECIDNEDCEHQTYKYKLVPLYMREEGEQEE